ncbi:MFS general substrate transporter [Apiospora kogelbergensis]|uniref:MFS general substrate transporter n=1 Tax=Apiospora kogelbergensis TaxID=1337665 RepID=UPI003132158A
MNSSANPGESQDREMSHAPEPPSNTPVTSPDPPPQPSYTIFSRRQKNFIVFMAGLGGFFSPLSANTYLPSIPDLASYLGVSTSLMNLTVTVFLIFQGFAPSLYGDLADMAGAAAGLPALLPVLRCLQSTGSGGLYALNSGVISDISTSAERGKYMGAAQSGIMLGPAVGPILGGVLSQYLGWRSIFWFLLIAGGVYLAVYAVAVPETARKVVGNGSVAPRAWWNKSLLQKHARRKVVGNGSEEMSLAAGLPKPRLRFPNPMKSLFIIIEKDCAVILLYNAIIYASWYTVTANLANLLKNVYNLDTLQIGLCYVPFGVGAALSIVANGRLQDWNYARTALAHGFTVDKKRGDDLARFPIERARLDLMWPPIFLGSLATVGFGWAAQTQAHLAVVLVLTFLMALFLTAVYNSMNLLLVDLYPESPSTASAANNLTRCLMAAGGPP